MHMYRLDAQGQQSSKGGVAEALYCRVKRGPLGSKLEAPGAQGLSLGAGAEVPSISSGLFLLLEICFHQKEKGKTVQTNKPNKYATQKSSGFLLFQGSKFTES